MKRLFNLQAGFYILITALCFNGVQSCSSNDHEDLNSTTSVKYQTNLANRVGNRTFNLAFSRAESANVIDYADSMSEEEKLAFSDEITRSNYQLTANDQIVVNKFAEYYVKDDFDTAIEKLQNDILALDLDDAEFDKYNQFVNVMIIMEKHETSKASTGNVSAKINKRAIGCAVAVASSVIGTFGLYACAVPTPALPAGCAIAIAGKLLSYAGMMLC